VSSRPTQRRVLRYSRAVMRNNVLCGRKLPVAAARTHFRYWDATDAERRGWQAAYDEDEDKSPTRAGSLTSQRRPAGHKPAGLTLPRGKCDEADHEHEHDEVDGATSSIAALSCYRFCYPTRQHEAGPDTTGGVMTRTEYVTETDSSRRPGTSQYKIERTARPCKHPGSYALCVIVI
jgi:hypothetical protein